MKNQLKFLEPDFTQVTKSEGALGRVLKQEDLGGWPSAIIYLGFLQHEFGEMTILQIIVEQVPPISLLWLQMPFAQMKATLEFNK